MKYNLHYGEIRGDVLRPSHGTNISFSVVMTLEIKYKLDSDPFSCRPVFKPTLYLALIQNDGDKTSKMFYAVYDNGTLAEVGQLKFIFDY